MSDFKLEFYTDDVGRRRKVSPRDQETMMRLWIDGFRAPAISEAFGVSESLVRTICYHVRQGPPQRRPLTRADKEGRA